MAQRSKINLLIAEIERGAYQRGLDDAARAINQALASLGAQALAEFRRQVSQSERETGPTARRFVVRPNSDSALVLSTVRIHPGQRGSEIHRLLAAGQRSINERTVRTALLRLKRRGVIEQRDGRWYVKPDLLSGPTEELANELKMGGGFVGS